MKRHRPSTAELLDAQTKALLTKLGINRARILKGLLAEAEGRTVVDGIDGPLPDTTPAARVAAWKELGKVVGVPGMVERTTITASQDANGKMQVQVVVRAPDTDAED